MPHERRVIENLIHSEDLSGLVENADRADSITYARVLLIFMALIIIGGLTMLYSTSYSIAGEKYVLSQLMWVILGSIGGAAAFLFGYRKVVSLWALWLAIAVVLLVIAATCFPAINGAHRWIKVRLPGFSFSIQPSEFAKIALTIFVAKYCSENLRTFSDIRWKGGILKLCAVAGLVLGCILLGKDLGTTVLAAATIFAVMLAAGLYLRYILAALGVAAAAACYIVLFDPMRLARVTSFLDPEKVAENEGYQLWHSLLALGSGNWHGLGFMEGRMKARYLPESHTDFIMSIVGEELGLIGITAAIALYAGFTWMGVKISTNSNSRLGMLLGFGLTIMIAMQSVINLAVISGSVPTKGMPAPFVSYGGSNMIMCLVAVGLLLSIAADTVEPGYNEPYLAAIKRKLGILPFLKHWRKE